MSANFLALVPPTPPIVSFERVICFKIVAQRGDGVPGDPVRWVTIWKTEDGETVAYDDPFPPEDSNTESRPKSG